MFGGGASLAEELHSVEELGASPRGGDLGLREASRSFTAWRSLELRRVEEKLRGASQHGGAWSFAAWRRFRASQRGEAWSFAAWRCLALRSFEELPPWSSWPSSWVEEEEKGEVEPKIASQNKPLMLKDFLELDCDTVPRLLDAELQRGRRQLPRTRSESARARISSSSIIEMLPFAVTAGWLLSRSLSKLMRIDFWRNRGKSSLEAEAVDGERLRSCSLPLPPGVSRCSSWSFMSDSGFNSDETKNGSGRKAAGDDVSDAATKASR
ncbi:hypothetical protein ZIOFF_036828 [Zingiber officinale]|uniref:Uncharacterized protein n=1 Tax=Zingiber officinale TaxID=94328 RepID=A0A8J5GHP6_ZINOF|nr:hypothetical protein ZIOFF_036828 [Zingiber officinale]